MKTSLMFALVVVLLSGCDSTEHRPLAFNKCQEGIRLWQKLSSQMEQKDQPAFWAKLDQICSDEIVAGGNPFVDSALYPLMSGSTEERGWYAMFLDESDMTNPDPLPRSRNLHWEAVAKKVLEEGYGSIPERYWPRHSTIQRNALEGAIQDRCNGDVYRTHTLSRAELDDMVIWCKGSIREVAQWRLNNQFYY